MTQARWRERGFPLGPQGIFRGHVTMLFMSHMIVTDKMATDFNAETTDSTANLYSSSSHYQPWSHKEYTLYPRRWFMIFVVCCINMANAMVRREREKHTARGMGIIILRVAY